ncbi:hypothetical protein GCM10022261_28580 [Brevibacterium daeguense]|uniref:Uncharacterized protein n=1 Tax=Brevibacterium daeguense TaxID=909936 RepID=A0ABP8EMX0_9MICO
MHLRARTVEAVVMGVGGELPELLKGEHPGRIALVRTCHPGTAICRPCAAQRLHLIRAPGLGLGGTRLLLRLTDEKLSRQRLRGMIVLRLPPLRTMFRGRWNTHGSPV